MNDLAPYFGFPDWRVTLVALSLITAGVFVLGLLWLIFYRR